MIENPFEDAGDTPDDSHVMLWKGFDLSAAGIYDLEFAPCPFCEGRRGLEKGMLQLTEYDRGAIFGDRRRWVKYVCCGDCGTCGPWGSSESEGLRAWNERAVLNGFALRQVLEVLDDLSAGKYCDIAGELTGDGYRVIDSLAHNLRHVLIKDESHGTH